MGNPLSFSDVVLTGNLTDIPPQGVDAPGLLRGLMTIDLPSGTIQTISYGLYNLPAPEAPAGTKFIGRTTDPTTEMLLYVGDSAAANFVNYAGGTFRYTDLSHFAPTDDPRYFLVYEGVATPAVARQRSFTLVGTSDNTNYPNMNGSMIVDIWEGTIVSLDFGEFDCQDCSVQGPCFSNINLYISMTVCNGDTEASNWVNFSGGNFTYQNSEYMVNGQRITVTWTGPVTPND